MEDVCRDWIYGSGGVEHTVRKLHVLSMKKKNNLNGVKSLPLSFTALSDPQVA